MSDPMSDPIFDPARWKDAPTILERDDIRARIPQRHEMELLHGVVHYDEEQLLAIGFHQSTPDDFWVRGHIPGRPLMPAVMMVEICAQISTFLGTLAMKVPEGQFFGFGGMEKARFRGQVLPGDKVLCMSKVMRVKRNFGFFQSQAFVGESKVAEGLIIGVLI